MNSDDLYQDHILDHFEHPRHAGHLDHPTHVADAANLSCGDSLHVEIVVDEKGSIQRIAWSGEGCAISQASASILSEFALGKSIPELQQLTLENVLQQMGLETLSPARIKCATLFLNAIGKI